MIVPFFGDVSSEKRGETELKACFKVYGNCDLQGWGDRNFGTEPLNQPALKISLPINVKSSKKKKIWVFPKMVVPPNHPF